MKSFALPQKETNIVTPQLPIYYIEYQNRRSGLVQMPEAATAGVLRKKVFFKFHKINRKLLCQSKHLWILQNNSGRLLLKADITIMKREIQIVFAVQSWMQYLLLRLKFQSAREASHYPVLWVSSRLLVTCISLIYLIDEFFFWFLVQLNKTKRLGEYKVLSFCFWC